MIRKPLFAAILLFTIVGVCFAADLNGSWSGMIQTPDGAEFPISYHLKTEGEKLTGTVDLPEDSLPIMDGKINGNKFSFKVEYQGTSYPIEGQLDGESLKVKVHFGDEVVEHELKKENHQ